MDDALDISIPLNTVKECEEALTWVMIMRNNLNTVVREARERMALLENE